MSKMDNTSFLPIFNHRHFKAVPGQNSLGGVSYLPYVVKFWWLGDPLQGGSEGLFKVADF